MKEIWKDILGYEGLYRVSNWGRIWSCRKNKILKLHTCQSDYVYIGLHKDGKVNPYKVHRLVAQTFIPNPNNLPEVNHIDEDKNNNRWDNLEWCDHKTNCNHGTRIARCAAGNPEAGSCHGRDSRLPESPGSASPARCPGCSDGSENCGWSHRWRRGT